jgi:hypothetical protein
MALRVITWPMGFIIVAQNQQVADFAADAGWAIFNIAATGGACVSSGMKALDRVPNGPKHDRLPLVG